LFKAVKHEPNSFTTMSQQEIEYQLLRVRMNLDDIIDQGTTIDLGVMSYRTSYIVRTTDPKAYREYFLDFVDSMIKNGKLASEMMKHAKKIKFGKK
jgi:hypothetical protein